MEKRVKRFLPVLLILFLLEASVLVSNAVSQSRKTFLWKVRSETGTAYVLGSVHILRKDVYPLDRRIEEAFEKSDVLVVEANMNDLSKIDAQKLMSRAFYTGGDTLADHLSKETHKLVEEEFSGLGMPLELLNRQKPWFLSLTLTSLELMKLGYDPNYGIDRYFLSKAEGKKRIAELESLDYQIDLLSGFSDSEQELLLRSALKDLKVLKDEVGNLVTAWKSGNAEAIEGMLSKSLGGERGMAPVYEKLFYERNRNMAAKIEEFLRTKETHFVVIGAGHMVGKKGIVEILRKRGYTVEQW